MASFTPSCNLQKPAWRPISDPSTRFSGWACPEQRTFGQSTFPTSIGSKSGTAWQLKLRRRPDRLPAAGIGKAVDEGRDSCELEPTLNQLGRNSEQPEQSPAI